MSVNYSASVSYGVEIPEHLVENIKDRLEEEGFEDWLDDKLKGYEGLSYDTSGSYYYEDGVNYAIVASGVGGGTGYFERFTQIEFPLDFFAGDFDVELKKFFKDAFDAEAPQASWLLGYLVA